MISGCKQNFPHELNWTKGVAQFKNNLIAYDDDDDDDDDDVDVDVDDDDDDDDDVEVFEIVCRERFMRFPSALARLRMEKNW